MSMNYVLILTVSLADSISISNGCSNFLNGPLKERVFMFAQNPGYNKLNLNGEQNALTTFLID